MLIPKVVATILVAVLLVGAVAPPASAQTAEIALGLAAFAVALDLMRFWAWPFVVDRQTTVYVYQPTPALGSPMPAPTASSGTVVQYPHGWYELRGDGVGV